MNKALWHNDKDTLGTLRENLVMDYHSRFNSFSQTHLVSQ